MYSAPKLIIQDYQAHSDPHFPWGLARIRHLVAGGKFPLYNIRRDTSGIAAQACERDLEFYKRTRAAFQNFTGGRVPKAPWNPPGNPVEAMPISGDICQRPPLESLTILFELPKRK